MSPGLHPSSRAARRVRAAIVVVVVLLVVSAGAVRLLVPGGNPIAEHPAPTLFAATQVRSVGDELRAQQAGADRLFAAWAAAHADLDRDAFSRFAVAQLPAPPGPGVQARELAELHQLAVTRTEAGSAAARWLELYGKKDVWKLYLRDAVETAPDDVRQRAKARLKDDRALSKSLTAAAQARFGRQAPTVLDPSLRPGAARKAKLSYPSKHAVYVMSELTLLSALDPGRVDEFSAMADQVAFSRLYAAGHYRSDLAAGAVLGRLLGDYELARLRADGGLPPPAPPG
ncbi:MAG: hypothetical protein JWO60_161 [Frankiales bacterium]|nr:hypothetical protein [Frankiales bacterium]